MAQDPADRFPSAGDLGRAAVAAAAGRALPGAERSVATGEAAPDTSVSPRQYPADSPPPPQSGSPTYVPPPAPVPPPRVPASAAAPPPPPPAPPAAPAPVPAAAAEPPTGGGGASRRNLLVVAGGAAGIIVLAVIVLAVTGAFGGGGSSKQTTTAATPHKPPPTADLSASYKATIDTGGTLSVQLNGARNALVHLAINMPLSCEDGTDDTFRTTFLSATDTQDLGTDGSFTFSGTAKADNFITGGKVTVSGRLQPDGTGTGTSRMIEHSRQHGRCDSSIGRWTATGS
jgi:hypothetical protein